MTAFTGRVYNFQRLQHRFIRLLNYPSNLHSKKEGNKKEKRMGREYFALLIDSITFSDYNQTKITIYE